MAFRTCESLDTNIILRIMMRDIPAQCMKIQDLFMRYGCTYYVPDLAITEAVFVMQRTCTREDIVNNIRMLFEMPGVSGNLELLEQVFPMYLAHRQLSFNDCYLSALAAMEEAEPLWTFDKDLAKKSPTAKLLA